MIHMRVTRNKWILTSGLIAGTAIALAGAPTVKTIQTKVVTKPIPRSASFQVSRTVSPGRMVTQKKGRDGALKTTYRLTLINGKVVSKQAVSSVRVHPVNDVILMGKPSISTSRSSFTRSRVIAMSATGYDTSPQTLPGSTGRTATGIPARFGIVAVDPRVIRLGTFVYVEGYGFALAADTGGAIKGNKIDLCFNSRREALNWGRRKVRVHVLAQFTPFGEVH
jgi:3D (Asp-Asp-Asp) domain-containing protein